MKRFQYKNALISSVLAVLSTSAFAGATYTISQVQNSSNAASASSFFSAAPLRAQTTDNTAPATILPGVASPQNPLGLTDKVVLNQCNNYLANYSILGNSSTPPKCASLLGD